MDMDGWIDYDWINSRTPKRIPKRDEFTSKQRTVVRISLVQDSLSVPCPTTIMLVAVLIGRPANLLRFTSRPLNVA